MFTNITENCVVSPIGSSPSSAVVGDWHTYDNCWRVQAARSAARVKVGPVPSTALSRTNRAPAAVRFCVPLRSVPFRAVLSVCLTGLPAPPSVDSLMSADFDGWPLPVMVRYVIHACHVADDTICHVGLADLSLFAILPFRFPPNELCPLERGLLLENLFGARGWRHPNVLALRVLRLRYWISLLILECTFKLLTEPVFEILSEFQYLLSSLGPFVLKLRFCCFSSSITFYLALPRKGWKPL